MSETHNSSKIQCVADRSMAGSTTIAPMLKPRSYLISRLAETRRASQCFQHRRAVAMGAYSLDAISTINANLASS